MVSTLCLNAIGEESENELKYYGRIGKSINQDIGN